MPSSRESLRDAERLLDKALEREDGLILIFKTRPAMTKFRARLYRFMKLVREEHYRLPPEDDAYGKSPYDIILLKVKEDKDSIQLHVTKGDKLSEQGIATVIDPITREELDLEKM